MRTYSRTGCAAFYSMAKATKTRKQKVRILVVDENIDSLKKLYIGLLQMQFDVEASDQVNEIIQRINRFKPAVLLMAQQFVEEQPNLYKNIRDIYKIPILRMVPAGDPSEQDEDTVVSPVRLAEVGEKIKLLLKK